MNVAKIGLPFFYDSFLSMISITTGLAMDLKWVLNGHERAPRKLIFRDPFIIILIKKEIRFKMSVFMNAMNKLNFEFKLKTIFLLKSKLSKTSQANILKYTKQKNPETLKRSETTPYIHCLFSPNYRQILNVFWGAVSPHSSAVAKPLENFEIKALVNFKIIFFPEFPEHNKDNKEMSIMIK